MSVPVTIPELGESVTEASILDWYKSEGDAVNKDEPIAELESDKATLDLPAPADGTLTNVAKKAGDTVDVGETIAEIQSNGEATDAKQAESDEQADVAEDTTEGDDEDEASTETDKEAVARDSIDDDADTEADAQTHDESERHDEPESETRTKAEDDTDKAEKNDQRDATLDARRMLDESGVDIDQVAPTGEGGVVLKKDVIQYLMDHPEENAARTDHKADEADETDEATDHGTKNAKEPTPDESELDTEHTDTSKLADDDASRAEQRGEHREPMSKLRRTVAARLVQAQNDAALVTTFNEADLTQVRQLRQTHGEAFQKRHGVKLGIMSFFVKATVEALRESPRVNARIDGDEIVHPAHCDIGIAVSSDKGLVVPIIRAAETLSFAAIEKAIGDFADRASRNKIEPDDLKGGSFTISNGGVFGSMLSTPIVNPPQSGVLGMHAIEDRPVACDGEVVVRPMMYLALTYDHRLVDGREGVTFLRRIVEFIEDPGRMALGI